MASSRRGSYAAALVAALIISSGSAGAAAFEVVGARALGMAGAHVALVDDEYAFHWNPAGLAETETWRLGLPELGVGIEQHNEAADRIDRIDEILTGDDLEDEDVWDDPDRVADLVVEMEKLAKPGTGVVVEAQGGVSLVIHGIGVSAFGYGLAGAYPIIDLQRVEPGDPDQVPDSIGNNDSAFEAWGYVLQQFAVGYARSVLPWSVKNRSDVDLVIGGNLKLLQGTTNYYHTSLDDEDERDAEDVFDENERDDNAIAADLGVLAKVGSTWRFGLVGRNLNGPSLDYAGPGEVELDPQIRLGAAFLPSDETSLALDLDLTEADSPTPGYSDRTVALGIEHAVARGHLDLRGGLSRNIAESDDSIRVGLGLGVNAGGFHADLAGRFDFDEDAVAIAFQLAFGE